LRNLDTQTIENHSKVPVTEANRRRIYRERNFQNSFDATARRRVVDDLTQIINALHRYHERHGHFPTANTQGKDGKSGPPHSWRVDLLPLLGYQDLYDQYRFDESWDSEHNASLLAKMPDIYRSPLDKPDSVNTSYFGVVSDDLSKRAAQLQQVREPSRGEFELDESAFIGDQGDAASQHGYEQYTPEATVFWRQRGAAFIDMLDGTSNCIAVIEAKRNVPWTKPEEIEYSADQPLPKFGGWFEEGMHAAFADGTVKFLSHFNDDETFRTLLTISDGQPATPLLVRRLRVHGAIAISGDEPEIATGPGMYQVPGGPRLRILTDQKPIFTEADLAEVASGVDPSGADIVFMSLTLKAAKRFLAATTELSERNPSGYLAILLDGKVVAVPKVHAPIGDSLTITGNFDAKALADQIQAAMNELGAGSVPLSAIIEVGDNRSRR
ncbi:MAG: DUF1559 domain-containing protein, partial [Pirellulaceae bacterium]